MVCFIGHYLPLLAANNTLDGLIFYCQSKVRVISANTITVNYILSTVVVLLSAVFNLCLNATFYVRCVECGVSIYLPNR